MYEEEEDETCEEKEANRQNKETEEREITFSLSKEEEQDTGDKRER